MSVSRRSSVAWASEPTTRSTTGGTSLICRPAVDNEGVGYPTRHPDEGEGVGSIIGEVDAECDQVRDSFPRELASAGAISRLLLYGKRKPGRCRFRHTDFKLVVTRSSNRSVCTPHRQRTAIPNGDPRPPLAWVWLITALSLWNPVQGALIGGRPIHCAVIVTQ